MLLQFNLYSYQLKNYTVHYLLSVQTNLIVDEKEGTLSQWMISRTIVASVVEQSEEHESYLSLPETTVNVDQNLEFYFLVSASETAYTFRDV